MAYSDQPRDITIHVLMIRDALGFIKLDNLKGLNQSTQQETMLAASQ